MKLLHTILGAFALAVATAAAQVLPSGSRLEEKSISEWTVDFFRWGYLQPTNQNPFLDFDGSRATNGQGGTVFFIAGGSQPGPQASRHYTVPEDKYLLVPLVIYEVDNIDTVPPLSTQELQEIAAELIDPTSELHLRIDTVDQTNLFLHREVTPVFYFNAPSADNLFTVIYGHPVSGLVDPAVADGYWAMIEPLGIGSHLLEFGGTYGPPTTFSYTRTDFITVLPVQPSELIASLAGTVAASEIPTKQSTSMLRNLQAARQALESRRPRGNVAAARLTSFEQQVRHAFPTDSATASNWVQRSENVISRILSPVGPLTNGAVLSTDAKIAGADVGGLQIQMWNWIYSLSTNQNPLLDCGSGQWATNGQPNPLVFFITPVNGSMPPSDRTFSVPENRFILMPVMGVTLDNIDTEPPLSEPEMRDVLNSILTNQITLAATIDGVSILNLVDHRHPSPAFYFDLINPDNWLSCFYGHPITGIIDPIIADGYWLLLEPLATGQHLLHGYGTNVYHLPHDITSHITVEQVPLDQWMIALKYWVQNAPGSGSRANKLTPNLTQAASKFQRGKIRPGIAQLRSFQKKVRTVLLPIDAALAIDLMRYAERIIQRAGKEL